MSGRKTTLTWPLCALLLLFSTGQALAQEPARDRSGEFSLEVPDIMRGPELVGESPREVRWTEDGRWVYFRWKPGGEPWHEDPSWYRVPVDEAVPERLSDERADSLTVLVASGDLSEDGTHKVVSHRGDLFLIEVETSEVRHLTRTESQESDPVLSRDGETVYFVANDQLVALDLDRGAVRQLTDIRPGPEPEEDEAEGREGFLEEQQEELFESVRRELREEEEEEAEEERREEDEPETVHLEPEERVMGLAVDDGARHAILTVGRPAPDERETIVPDYVTPTGYTEEISARDKVGGAQSRARMGLVSLETGEVEWLELGNPPDVSGEDGTEDEDDGEEVAENATEDGAARNEEPPLAAARFLGWNEQGSAGLIGAVSRDFRDQWLYVLDAASGELTMVAHDRDDAWIGGPCSMWASPSCAGWMPDGQSIWFLSERDGWSHLYTLETGDSGSGDPRQLTSGEWEVYSAEITPDDEDFAVTASRESPFVRHAYRMDLEGGDLIRVTSGTGRFEATLSPDGERLAVVHSEANRPPELFLMENRPGAQMRRVTASPTEAWGDIPWIVPEIVHFEARDGASLPARIYRPEDLGAEPNGAGVIFVHGAGYLHNVHRWWSSYYREYMFHHLLASRGYTVLDIDYRGSQGYGRDWRTAIYRHMGGKDLTDQVDGARHLAEREGIDPERIGIYGGSYGGFITLMALFRHPDAFAAGAALRSVTDWAHYNHWYTGRILNLPQADEEAYRRSSPIYFAEGLEDPLLIAHGMVDTNVHFQDVVRLAQRLIELGKEDWELAVYPEEGHGFESPEAWTDEYHRILELFERHLQ